MQLTEFSGPVELEQALQESGQSLLTVYQGLDSFLHLFGIKIGLSVKLALMCGPGDPTHCPITWNLQLFLG